MLGVRKEIEMLGYYKTYWKTLLYYCKWRCRTFLHSLLRAITLGLWVPKFERKYIERLKTYEERMEGRAGIEQARALVARFMTDETFSDHFHSRHEASELGNFIWEAGFHGGASDLKEAVAEAKADPEFKQMILKYDPHGVITERPKNHIQKIKSALTCLTWLAGLIGLNELEAKECKNRFKQPRVELSSQKKEQAIATHAEAIRKAKEGIISLEGTVQQVDPITVRIVETCSSTDIEIKNAATQLLDRAESALNSLNSTLNRLNETAATLRVEQTELHDLEVKLQHISEQIILNRNRIASVGKP